MVFQYKLPWCLALFFFQAEDGIRDVLGSRGLGDVYKRQESPTGYELCPAGYYEWSTRGSDKSTSVRDGSFVAGKLFEPWIL